MTWFGIRSGAKNKWAYEDALLGKLIRLRDGGKCRMCGQSDRQLHTAHYIGRRKLSVRWDPDNVFLLCSRPCHVERFDMEKKRDRTGASDLWVRAQLGEQRYQRILIRANLTMKPEREMIRQSLREQIKEYDKVTA